jgi:hypothetical protein
MAEEEAAVLAAAAKLPIPERVQHAHWKARAQAYEHVRDSCARAFSEDDPCFAEYGALLCVCVGAHVERLLGGALASRRPTGWGRARERDGGEERARTRAVARRRRRRCRHGPRSLALSAVLSPSFCPPNAINTNSPPPPPPTGLPLEPLPSIPLQ